MIESVKPLGRNIDTSTRPMEPRLADDDGLPPPPSSERPPPSSDPSAPLPPPLFACADADPRTRTGVRSGEAHRAGSGSA
eukprot:363042-Chlamydomonas_euryale.AAC.4